MSAAQARRRSAAASVLGVVAALASCSGGAGRVVVHTEQHTRAALHEQRSTTASRCSLQLPPTPPLVGAARVDMVLVPIAAIRVDACVYHEGTLVSHATALDGALADDVENAANTLQGQDPGSGTTCTPATRSQYLVLFDDGIHGTGVGGALGGCTTVTNSFLTASVTAPWREAVTRLLQSATACAQQFGSASGCVVSGTW